MDPPTAFKAQNVNEGSSATGLPLVCGLGGSIFISPHGVMGDGAGV